MTDFKKVIANRRSVRKYLDKKVEKEKIDALVKAALLAPSGKRMFPCEYIVVEDEKTLLALSEAKTHGAKLLAKAPLGIVIAVDTNKYDVWVEDASVASTFVMLAAEDLGLGCCWVQMHLRGTEDGNTSAHNMKKILNLPDGFDLLSVLAIGYKDEIKPAYADDDLKWEKVHYERIGGK